MDDIDILQDLMQLSNIAQRVNKLAAYCAIAKYKKIKILITHRIVLRDGVHLLHLDFVSATERAKHDKFYLRNRKKYNKIETCCIDYVAISQNILKYFVKSSNFVKERRKEPVLVLSNKLYEYLTKRIYYFLDFIYIFTFVYRVEIYRIFLKTIFSTCSPHIIQNHQHVAKGLTISLLNIQGFLHFFFFVKSFIIYGSSTSR